MVLLQPQKIHHHPTETQKLAVVDFDAAMVYIKNHLIHLYLFLSYYIQEFEKLNFFCR